MCPRADECDEGVGDKCPSPGTGVGRRCENGYMRLMEVVRFLMVSRNESGQLESNGSWEAVEYDEADGVDREGGWERGVVLEPMTTTDNVPREKATPLVPRLLKDNDIRAGKV
jgi:hypothetical protein